MFSIDFPYIGSIFGFLCTNPLQLETDVTRYWLYNDGYSITHQLKMEYDVIKVNEEGSKNSN